MNTFLMGIEHGSAEQCPGESIDDATYQVSRLAYKAGAWAAVDYMLRQGHFLPGEEPYSRDRAYTPSAAGGTPPRAAPRPQARKLEVITIDEALALDVFFPVTGKERWYTVGVNENIIDASLQALLDSIEFRLLKK